MTSDQKTYSQPFNERWGLLIKDLSFCVFLVTMTLVFKSQIPLMAGFFLIFFHLKFTKRLNFIVDLIMGFLTALIWVSFAKQNYHYDKNFLEINGISVWAVVVWGMSLFGASIILSHLNSVTKNNLIHKILLNTLLFSIVLIILEYLAHNVFNFKNQATINYKPIPIINCIYAPQWMQFMYFCIGPIYGFLMHSVRHISGKYINYDGPFQWNQIRLSFQNQNEIIDFEILDEQ
jgi:hypothetical protein